jgi:alpha-galactosidase
MAEDLRIEIPRSVSEFAISELNAAEWKSSNRLAVFENWNGTYANDVRHFHATLLWSDDFLYIRFETKRGEPLVVANAPSTKSKTIGLWERDVCEIFIAPDRNEPKKYFEFEIAPTGEWLDLAIDSTSGERVTDWEYASGMKAAALIEENRVVMTMKIPWKAFGKKPKAGDVWLGNIFRCVGKEPQRGYLAWRPTMTETPNFHVPEAFGEFIFE